MKQIKVLRIKPHCIPEIVRIPLGLESLQKEVGGTIQVTYPWDDPVALICNEEGKLLGFGIDNFNRTLLTDDGTPIDVIAGTFLITGLTEDDFGSLSPELLAKYEKMFHCPERFWRTIDEHGRTHLKIDYEPENTVK